MALADAEKWNAKYAELDYQPTEPLQFLVDRTEGLHSGSALVLAAGAGWNAVYLAEQGFEVTALDISEVGLELCRELATLKGVSLNTVCADLDDYDLGDACYDLITKFYFYNPSLFPAVRRALKPWGLFLFLTYSEKHAEVGTFGARNPAYLASRQAITETFGQDDIDCDEIVIETDEHTQAILTAAVRV